MGAHVASRLRFRSRVRPSSSAYSRVCSPWTIVLKLKAARALLATVQIPTAAETPVSYLNHVLQPGETVRYQGSVHWILYLPPIFLSVIGAVAAFTGPVGLIVATVCFAVALVVALRAWFIRWTTEIAVTNLRVIYAQGFIQRRSVEVHMDRSRASTSISRCSAGYSTMAMSPSMAPARHSSRFAASTAPSNFATR